MQGELQSALTALALADDRGEPVRLTRGQVRDLRRRLADLRMVCSVADMRAIVATNPGLRAAVTRLEG